eukprot:Pgem_evm1s19015
MSKTRYNITGRDVSLTDTINIQQPLSTGGFESDVPLCFANEIQGGFMVFQTLKDMLNLMQQKRVIGMLVFLTSKGPMNQPPNQFYRLLGPTFKEKATQKTFENLNPDDIDFSLFETEAYTDGSKVGPKSILDYLNNETLSVYDKQQGKTYKDDKKKNTDDGSRWLRLCLDCTDGDTTIPPKNIDYYYGTLLPTSKDYKITENELKSLDKGSSQNIPAMINIENKSRAVQVPYFGIPNINNKWIKSITIAGSFTGKPTQQFLVGDYLVARTSGALQDKNKQEITNIVFESDQIKNIGGLPIDTTGPKIVTDISKPDTTGTKPVFNNESSNYNLEPDTAYGLVYIN